MSPSEGRATSWARWVLLIAVGLTIAFAVSVWRLGSVKDALAQGLALATGRTISIDGRASLRPGLRPGFLVNGLSLGPAPDSALSRLEIDRVDIEFALLPLLLGRIDIFRLHLTGVEVWIDTSGAALPEPTAKRDESGWGFDLRGIDISDVTIEISDGASPPTTVRIEQLSLQRSGSENPVVVRMAGSLGRLGFDLSGDLARQEGGSEERARFELEGRGQVGGVEVTGSGWFDSTGFEHSADFEWSAQADDLSGLSRVFEMELPALALRASTHLALSDGRLDLSELEASLGARESAFFGVKGGIEDLLGRRELQLDAELELRKIAALRPLVGDPPEIGPIAGRAKLSTQGGRTALEDLVLRGGRPGVFEIDLTGSARDLLTLDGLDASLTFQMSRLPVLAELLKTRLPDLGPIEFSGPVKGSAAELRATGLQARLGDTRVDGALRIELPEGARPRLSADLHSALIDLSDFGILPSEASEASTVRPPPEPVEADPSDRVFGEAEIPLDWMRGFDGRLTLRIEHLRGAAGGVIEQLDLEVSLEDQKLDANHIALHIGGGRSAARILIDPTVDPPRYAASGTLRSVEIGQIVEQFQRKSRYSGAFDASFDLESNGSSPHEIASGLDGDVTLSCDGGVISIEAAGLLTRDVVRSIRGVMGVDSEEDPLDCLLVDFGFEDGTGQARTIFVETEALRLVGTGTIDLETEALDLRLIPTLHDARAMSTAPTVDVAGTLKHPETEVDRTSLVTSTTRALLERVGSLTLVRQSWERLTQRKPGRSRCEQLLAPTETPANP